MDSEMENARLKDQILLFVTQHKFPSRQEISNSLNIDLDITTFLLSEIEKDKYITQTHVSSEKWQVSATQPGRGFLKASGYFKQYEERQLQLEKLNLEVEKLRNDFFDYSKTKSRAIWAIRLSALTLFATILLGLLRLICKTPG